MVSCIRHIFQSADLQREDGQKKNDTLILFIYPINPIYIGLKCHFNYFVLYIYIHTYIHSSYIYTYA